MRSTFFVIVLAAASPGIGAWAAEPPPAKPPATSTETPAAAPAQTAAEKKDDAKAVEPAPPLDDAKTAAEKAAAKPSDAKASPQRFIPSEQVRADFDVSFPIDI